MQIKEKNNIGIVLADGKHRIMDDNAGKSHVLSI